MEVNKPISVIILLVITLVLVFLFVVPKYNESKHLQQKLAQSQAEYDGASAYYAKISALLSDISTRKEALGKISSALPSEVSLGSLVYFFQKKAAETGLTPKTITLSQALAASPAAKEGQSSKGQTLGAVRNVVFSLELLGNYQGLKNFIAALEKSARLFEVNTISFSSLRPPGSVIEKNPLQTYSFRLQVQTHTY